MNGTTKQIEWAEQIKAAAVRNFDAIRAKLSPEGMAMGNEQQQARCKALLALLDEWQAETSAAWWIDNRDWLDGQPGQVSTGGVIGRATNELKSRGVA